MIDKAPDEWTGEERRGFDGLVLRIMTEVREVMSVHELVERSIDSSMREEIQSNRKESDTRHAEAMARLDSIENTTVELVKGNMTVMSDIHKMFKQAFPDGDVNEHRKSHEAWIEKDKADKEFWVKLKLEVVKWGVLVIAGWAGIAVWVAFLKGPTP